jgi:2-oxoglutarate ferredoxin oxidoreductase subunit alpha
MENQVFLGATFGLLGLEFKHLAAVITDEFKGKGEQVVKENLSVAQAGYDNVLHRYEAFHHRLKPIEGQPKRMFLTGNDALSFGAIKAGLGFYVAYPMTPATSILHNLAELQHQYGYVVKHAEDEISVVNMAIGAGHAGVRSMCGTSGGGFALMSEGYSLAGITETPVVIVEAMRGGPATGLPTWTEQADLKFLLSAGHGEFPRFVLAPGDPEECYTMIGEAFNIAEEYQTPVIVAVDKHLAESNWSYPLFTQDVPIRRGPWATDAELQKLAGEGKRFKRYDFATTNGVSKRVVPGQHRNGIFLANSDEHDEYGYTTEEIEGRNAMSAKRLRKESSYAATMPAPALYGAKDAELTIVCWGSTKHAVLQALEWLQGEGRSVNVLHLTHLSPFPAAAVEAILRKAKTVLDVELNATGQLADVIRMHTSYHIKERLLKNDGRPMLPEEVVDKARALSHAKGVRA